MIHQHAALALLGHILIAWFRRLFELDASSI
jgi:hypothetical protein